MEEYQDRSLRGRVFQRLREDILSGVYQEHDELREITIGEELGVSRTPVREALRQLELEGLVKIIPNKGAYVTGITLKDVADIYKIRSMLEGMCARWATKHITEKQIEELEETADEADGLELAAVIAAAIAASEGAASADGFMVRSIRRR